jgi:hypothetical protein
VDASGSVAGGTALVVYHYGDGDGGWSRSPSNGATLGYEEPGVRDLEVVVVDGNACADAATGRVYVGTDDGTPAGPVDVEAVDAEVSAGAGTEVTLRALDCRGDVAAGEDVAVRADLGTLDADATGEGLVIGLDALGMATFTWSFPVDEDGEATLEVGTGGACGSTTVSVTGESRLPQVVEMTPAGEVQGTVSRLYVELDDLILDYDALYDAATLSGPGGVVGVDVSIADDGRTLEIVPASTVDAGAGIWTLTLTDDVRDDDGNRLDGAWSGARGSFVGTFGDVPVDAPATDGCAADAARFVPDGDDGAGEEADEVTLAVSAASTPSFWWWRVYDDAGERVRNGRAAGTDAAIVWDGRDDDGRVVSSGEYTVRVVAVDEWDNAGEACTEAVTVAQHVEAP